MDRESLLSISVHGALGYCTNDWSFLEQGGREEERGSECICQWSFTEGGEREHLVFISMLLGMVCLLSVPLVM